MTNPTATGTPLCVDLDGTLIRSDILWESLIQVWKHPLALLKAICALLTGGKAAFKTAISRTALIDPSALPYRTDVMDFIKEQKSAGRPLILATATHQSVAVSIAAHLGLFSEVLGSTDELNLSGKQKRDALINRFGNKGFDYIGDSHKDIPVFESARHALLVNPSGSTLRAASAISEVTHVFEDRESRIKAVAQALRLHQWAKNLLLAVPLFSAHLITDTVAWINIALAFLIFGSVASANYVVNDLLDLKSDRRHAHKFRRPFASGRLSIPNGLILSTAIGGSALLASVLLMPAGFSGYLLAYLVLTLSYSLWIKRKLLVDVLALALLYTIRILAGGAAIKVAVSEWLLMFSLFLFLSLAFLKRAIELQGSSKQLSGRGYSNIDLEMVRTIGVSAGMMSVMVLALYISSPAVNQLYGAPQILWLLCPILTYWVARVWFLAVRGEVHHDPVVFALLDGRSYFAGICGVAVIFCAKFGPRDFHW